MVPDNLAGLCRIATFKGSSRLAGKENCVVWNCWVRVRVIYVLRSKFSAFRLAQLRDKVAQYRDRSSNTEEVVKLVFGLGPSELLVILIIVILIYGGKRIPEIGQGLGKSIREFKKAKNEYEEQDVVEKWVDETDKGEAKNATGALGNIGVSEKSDGVAGERSSSDVIKEKVERIK